MYLPPTPPDVSVVGHLRLYRDLGESTNIDLGGSYARGHNTAGVGSTTFDPGNFLTNLYSADATLRWKPLRRSIYHSFLLRNEFFWSARDQVSLANANVFQTQHAFGLYSDAEYRVNRRWTLGGRFDRSGRATNASLTDSGFSGILTYWPSEFSQIRGQYRYGHLWDVPNDRYTNANEFLFQFCSSWARMARTRSKAVLRKVSEIYATHKNDYSNQRDSCFMRLHLRFRQPSSEPRGQQTSYHDGHHRPRRPRSGNRRRKSRRRIRRARLQDPHFVEAKPASF